MNAPMVVVQGDLLLPTLFPLAGMPNAVYGEEWTLTRARPALTEYEIPFYAARFLTAYINALSLRSDRFPYTPVSLWGKFKRNDEVNHAEQGVGVPPIPDNAAPQAAEPAPFAFEPFTAPDDRHVKTPAANNDHRKQLAGGAIALACAAFIAWALFGTKIGHQDAETQKPKLVLSATPTIEPIADSETAHASGASNATVAVASASTGASNSAAAYASTAAKAAVSAGASSAPAKTAAAAGASAARSTAIAIAALPAVQKPLVVSGTSGNNKPPVSTTAIVNHARAAAPYTVSEHATKARAVAQTLEHKGSKAKAKSKRDAHRYEVVHRRHGHEYQGAPVYRSTGLSQHRFIAAPGMKPRSHRRAAVRSRVMTHMQKRQAHRLASPICTTCSRTLPYSMTTAALLPASQFAQRPGKRRLCHHCAPAPAIHPAGIPT